MYRKVETLLIDKDKTSTCGILSSIDRSARSIPPARVRVCVCVSVCVCVCVRNEDRFAIIITKMGTAQMSSVQRGQARSRISEGMSSKASMPEATALPCMTQIQSSCKTCSTPLQHAHNQLTTHARALLRFKKIADGMLSGSRHAAASRSSAQKKLVCCHPPNKKRCNNVTISNRSNSQQLKFTTSLRDVARADDSTMSAREQW